MKNDLKMMTREQYDEWLKDRPEGVCTFCNWKENQIVLYEGWRWLWIVNIAPYWWYHTMLIPKRHITKFTELNDFELLEFKELFTYAMDKYRGANLVRADGSDIKKYVYFWRDRDDQYDPKSGTIRPNHFHIHIAPDKDHLWDSILDKDAYQVDVVEKLK